jgi:hypothetical protein
MKATMERTYDVFISHAASDCELASEIADCLEAAGFETFYTGSVESGTDMSEAIWQALTESRALIAIISADVPAHAMGLVEIGAAAAWNKPIYLLVNGPASTKMPEALAMYPIYPVNLLQEVIQAIRSGVEPFSEHERRVLARTYENLHIPADQLSQSSKALRALTTQFNKTTHKQFSGERLLSEILRMRKQGQLPRLTRLPQAPRVKSSPFHRRKSG